MSKPLNSAQKRVLWAAQVTPPGQPPRRPAPHPLKDAGPPRRWLKRVITIVILVLALGGGIFGYKIIAAGDSISAADRSILGQLKDLLFSQGQLLAGEEDDRINLLLIAVGGEGHKGEDLADTIMVASIQPTSNTAALLSIPRDLYVQVPGQEYYSKINAVHAYGESQKTDQGPELLRDLTEDITGLPIHYYVRVDFTAFKSIIDAVGGVNISNDNSFYDYWHKISFPAGVEKMNGERALAFVRARYIEGSEGGDFKRAGRQQQVLLALRDKIFSYQTALDFTRANSILNSLSDNIRTDMQLWEMKRIYELARITNPASVGTVVLTTGPKGVLTGDTEVLGGVPASVLKPRTGDYSEIQSIARDIFVNQANANEPAAEASALPDPTATPAPVITATVEVRNGTNITGLAGRTADKLSDDYDITTVGNSAVRDQTTTNVYYASPVNEAAAQTIASIVSGTANNQLPSQEADFEADILVVLGQDAQ